MELTLSGSDNYSSHVLLEVALRLVDDNEGQYALLTTGASVSPLNDAKIYVRFVPRYTGDQVMGKIEATGGGVTIQNLLVGIVEPALPGAHLHFNSTPTPLILSRPSKPGQENPATLDFENAAFSTDSLRLRTHGLKLPFRLIPIDTSLAPGEPLSFQLYLDSAKSGSYFDTLLIETNALKATDGVIKLAVQGIVKQFARVSVAFTNLSFIYSSQQDKSDSADLTIRVSATGEPVWITIDPPAHPFYFSDSSTPLLYQNIVAGSLIRIPIKFRPNQLGRFRDTLYIRTNASGVTGPIPIRLLGESLSLQVDQPTWPKTNLKLERTGSVWRVLNLSADDIRAAKLYDVLGRDCSVWLANLHNGIELSNPPPGSYFLQVAEQRFKLTAK